MPSRAAGKTPPTDAVTDDHAAFLERIRRSGIRIDREGEFWHEGETVRHEGLRRALYRWLDREGGSGTPARYVLRLDESRFATIEVEDTPLVARALRWEGSRALLALSDGAEEALDPATLTIDEAGVLRCLVRRGRLEARLSSSALAALADRFDLARPLPPRR